MEDLPRSYAPFITRLAALSFDAERSGNSSELVAVADKILSLSDVKEYPHFAASVRLERAYALSMDARGVSESQARSLRTEVTEATDGLRNKGQLDPRLGNLRVFIDGTTSLVLGVNSASPELLIEANALLHKAANVAKPVFPIPVARLFAARTAAFLAIAARTGIAGAVMPDRLYKDLNLLTQRENAKSYTIAKRFAYSYHLTAATLSHELWLLGARPKISDSSDSQLDFLNRSFTMAMGAAHQQPDVVGTPLAWPGELAVVFSQVVISACADALTKNNQTTRPDLQVLVGRLRGAFGQKEPYSLETLARTIAGLIQSDKVLQQAIFGPGRLLSPLEREVLGETLEMVTNSAKASTDGHDVPTLFLKGIDRALAVAEEAAA